MLPKYGLPQPELVGDTLLKHVAILRQHNANYNDYQMAAALGLPEEIFVGRLSWAESQHTGKLRTLELGTPLTVTGDAMIVGDVHVPFTDFEYAHLVGKVAEKALHEPRQLIIAGDYFNLDIFSDWAKLVEGPHWKDEKEAAIALMHEWMRTFDMVYYLAGNHDRRISRKMEGEMNIFDLADFLSVPAHKIRPSLFGHCTLKSKGIDWRVSHTREYSINRLTVAGELALKFQSNIIAFHEHHQAIGWDRFGRYCIVNGGSLVKQDALAYCTLDDSKRPYFNTGFVMVRRGTPTLFGHSPLSAWEEWI